MTNIEFLQKQVADLQARLDQVTCERNEWRKMAQVAEAPPATDHIVFAAPRLRLTATECRVLQSLWARPVTTHAQLGADIYGPADLADRSNSIKVWMVRLRQKLGGSDMIDTVWGIGYHLTDAGRAKINAVAA